MVDDDPTIRRVLAKIIRWRGYRAVHASSFSEGLKTARHTRISAITIDYELGGSKNGADLALKLRETFGTETPPLILVSSLALELPRHERALFDDVHPKPFHALELLDALDSLVEGAESPARQSGIRYRRPNIHIASHKVG